MGFNSAFKWLINFVCERASSKRLVVPKNAVKRRSIDLLRQHKNADGDQKAAVINCSVISDVILN